MKNILRSLGTAIIFFACQHVFAQQYAFVPASFVGNNIPWNSANNMRQNLYYPADFSAPSGSITTLYIMPDPLLATVSYTNVTVRMGATALTTFTSGPWAAGLTTVFNGPVTLNANAAGWFPLTLTTPYVYNNTQNLIVEFSTAGSTGPSTYFVRHANSGVTDRSLYGTSTSATGTVQPRLQQLGFDMITCAGPTGLAATGVTATSANFTWGAVTPSVGYEWVLNTSATPPTGAGTPVATTSYSATGLTPSTTYYFHVRNLCTSSSSSAWATVSFTTAPLCPAPSAAVISSILQTSATATWTAVPGSSGYEWAVTTSSAPPASGSATGATSQSLTGLTVGTQYFFHLRNVCPGGLFSAWVTTSFSTPCEPITGLNVSSIGFNGATINWTAVPGSAGYEWVATTSATPPASGTASSVTTVNATGLNGGTLYYVHVRNNCGAAGFSPWVTTIFTTASSCTLPTNIIITNVGPTSADIQWDPVPGAAGFEYIVDNTPQTPTIPGAAIAFNSYKPNNLVSATRYYVHIRTNCGSSAGFSPWVTVQFTTDTLCFAPVAVIDDIRGTAADISWQAEANAVNYQYLVSTSITPPFSGYATTATKYIAKGLNKNTQYYMHLRTYCGGNDISAWRSTGFVTNEQTTGISSSAGSEKFITVYPNPVTDMLTIKLSGMDRIDGTAIVADITGRVLKSAIITSAETQVSMSELPAGIYMIRYKDANHENNFKIIKQ